MASEYARLVTGPRVTFRRLPLPIPAALPPAARSLGDMAASILEPVAGAWQRSAVRAAWHARARAPERTGKMARSCWLVNLFGPPQ